MSFGYRWLAVVAATLAVALASCGGGSTDTPVAADADATATAATESETASRLDLVRDRGRVVCASNNAIPGFGFLDDGGNNAGFDIDLCRAVAAAVLGDPRAIEIRQVSATEMGVTLQSGEVDMLVRTVTVSSSREAQWGNFGPIMYYDGQGLMLRKSLGLSSVLDAEGATVCVTQGTTTELNLQDFSNLNNLNIEPKIFEKTEAAVAAYLQGQCDAFTTDHSGLFAYRSGFEDPEEHVILPQTISEEPLGPGVPHGDEQWYDIVRTVMAILIYAEAYDITSDNVPTALTGNSKVDRLLGLEGSYGQETLGLSRTAAQDVIRAVGNYGEVYHRTLGAGGVGLPREDGGRNALWHTAPCADCPKGGQIYAPPLR